MITMAPFSRLLVERNIDLEQLSQLTQIPYPRLATFRYGVLLNQEELDIMCRILKCQPEDIIVFNKDKGGHWEWVVD